MKGKSIYNIHFVGIGGVSMKTLATYCLSKGMLVSGSDITESDAVRSLRSKGVHILDPDDVSFIPECDAVVYTAAIPESNCQLCAAKAAHVPTMERKAFLGLVARQFDKVVAIAGTHGKTTVTAMTAAVFDAAKKSFAAHIGGDVNGAENSMINKGDEWFVTEACEYNRSFLTLNPDVTVILNVRYDHPDCYKSMEDMRQAYEQLIANTRAGGKVVCYKALTDELNFAGRKPLTFGYDRDCDYRACNITYSGGKYSFWIYAFGKKRIHVDMPLYGKHNVLNTLAAFAVADICGTDDASVACALENFKGVRGRFEQKGTSARGACVIYDYAHHPDEIKATIETAAAFCKGKIAVVFEPHTFSRTKALMSEFCDCLSAADMVVLVPTYRAREVYTDEGSSYDLYVKMKKSAYCEVLYAPDYGKAAEVVCERTGQGDMILLLGAGTVYKIADMV